METKKDWREKLNQAQKIVLAVGIPTILFVIAYASADVIAYYDVWIIWLFYVLIVVGFEFVLFGNKKD
jgi:hypothetical protein